METPIRLATLDDLNQILHIVSLVVPIMNEGGNFQWDHLYPNEEKFRQDLANDFLWVYEVQTDNQSKKVVGFCAITTEQDAAYADCGFDTSILSIVPHRLAVHPEHRKLGIARKFMLFSEDIAHERRIDRVRVDTNKINVVMRSMFEKLGYTYWGEIELAFKREGMKFVCYEKLLV